MQSSFQAEGTRQRIAGMLAEQLPIGIFLCVGGETPNVMTIGWGGYSFYWGKDLFIAPVRPQRFTYPLLQKEMQFTLCVPAKGAMKEELRKAGTLTGRDGNKFDAIGLSTVRAKTVNAPVISDTDIALVLECRVLAKNAFAADAMESKIASGMYANGDFHTLFYGEILTFYESN